MMIYSILEQRLEERSYTQKSATVDAEDIICGGEEGSLGPEEASLTSGV
jgi:hypothetical protein